MYLEGGTLYGAQGALDTLGGEDVPTPTIWRTV